MCAHMLQLSVGEEKQQQKKTSIQRSNWKLESRSSESVVQCSFESISMKLDASRRDV